jgi:hypothetical protein
MADRIYGGGQWRRKRIMPTAHHAAIPMAKWEMTLLQASTAKKNDERQRRSPEL